MPPSVPVLKLSQSRYNGKAVERAPITKNIKWRSLSTSSKQCAKFSIARAFLRNRAIARAEADEAGETLNETDVLADSLTFDPRSLPELDRSDFLSAFGDSKVQFEFDDHYFHATASFGVKGMNEIVIYDGSDRTAFPIEDLESTDKSASQSKDEHVLTRIKTGKGGWAYFSVPKHMLI